MSLDRPTNVPATGEGGSFGPVRQVDAGLLNVGYVEAGPADGPAVLLLHGWPYDIHSYAEVVPLLAAEGYRVTVPYLRGFGTTRFLSDETPRNGEQAALAVDAIALMDALGIENAIVAGFDWGARTADIVAALWPERCNGLVSVSGYLIGSQAAGKLPLPPEAELQWWYQYYFATERGRAGYDRYRREFAKLIWRTASPQWAFDDATFDRSAAAFDNADHVDDRDSQLSLATGAGRRRGRARRAGEAPRRRARDQRAHRDARGRCQRCAPSRAEYLRREILRRRIRTARSRAASGTTSPRKPRRPSPGCRRSGRDAHAGGASECPLAGFEKVE